MNSEGSRLDLAGTRAAPARRPVLVVALFFLLSPLAYASASAAEVEDSCVDCHRNPNFLVTNRKLYEYFQDWSLSVHKQEEVTCVDCHGGDAGVPDKEGAHGGDLAESASRSAVNFRNIPRTCGECHDEIYEGFRESKHFEHVVAKKQEEQGPTCVTCHGSINVEVLNVRTVAGTCTKCHNEETDNHPENAEAATNLLNRFLLIHRYYRYVTVRGDPAETREFLEHTDAQIHALSVTWHTFDIDEIKEQTEIVIDALKRKREQVAGAYKEKRKER